ncbi:hypothetical protein QL285_089219 [Trifolium repens]|nr:hypothetical protein QL285_089219 [Trifolium repens]
MASTRAVEHDVGLSISPKVKHFMWRFGMDCLPNRQRLVTKWVECHENCSTCLTYNEYNWHVFLNCADSVACWKKMNIWDKLERPMQEAESFSQFFTNIRRLDQSQLVTLICDGCLEHMEKKEYKVMG